VELPHVEKLYRELKSEGFGLVTVTADPADQVLKLVEYNGITHPMVSDHDTPAADKVYDKYHAYDGKHYLIGSDGTVLAAFSKLGVSLPILRRELAKHGIGSQGPVRWQAPATPLTARRGGRLSVTLSVSINEGWHIYAMTQGSGGPAALSIGLSGRQPFAITGNIASPSPVVRFDRTFGIDVAEHEGKVDFILPIVVAADAPTGAQTLTVMTRYQACNASLCLPQETKELRIPVTISASGGASRSR
jgi:thiol:disulfide interchange protein DsbD